MRFIIRYDTLIHPIYVRIRWKGDECYVNKKDFLKLNSTFTYYLTEMMNEMNVTDEMLTLSVAKELLVRIENYKKRDWLSNCCLLSWDDYKQRKEFKLLRKQYGCICSGKKSRVQKTELDYDMMNELVV